MLKPSEFKNCQQYISKNCEKGRDSSYNIAMLMNQTELHFRFLWFVTERVKQETHPCLAGSYTMHNIVNRILGGPDAYTRLKKT